jgi:hypothetical protein
MYAKLYTLGLLFRHVETEDNSRDIGVKDGGALAVAVQILSI